MVAGVSWVRKERIVSMGMYCWGSENITGSRLCSGPALDDPDDGVRATRAGCVRSEGWWTQT